MGLVVSLFFLYWAFQQGSDLRSVARALAQANYLYVVPALVAYFLGVAVRAVRWRLLLRPLKPLPARRLFPVVVIGYMANDVLPARMGEFVRAYVLGRGEGVSKSASLATIFVERVLDGLTMLLFIAAVAMFVPLDVGLGGVVRLAAGLLVALLLLALIIAARPKLAAVADRFLSGLGVLQSPRAMLSALGLSLLAWLCEATMYYVLSFGFALGLGFDALVLTTAVVNLGTMVPSSPGYVGTFEALAVFTLRRFAVAGDLALSYAVALHAALLVPVTLLGFYYMWRWHVSFQRLAR